MTQRPVLKPLVYYNVQLDAGPGLRLAITFHDV